MLEYIYGGVYLGVIGYAPIKLFDGVS